MTKLEEIRQSRIEKINFLKEQGLDSYPIEVKRTKSLFEAKNDFSKLTKRKSPLFLVGRIMSIRAQGAIMFISFYDGTDRFQAFLKKDNLGEKQFDLFKKAVDIGDFIEFSGGLFLTKKKEKSINVKSWRMLSKSLRPLPEKWHGLSDTEERFRRRYLDALMNSEIKERFQARSKIISSIRNFMDKNDYMEVETPMLQTQAGGATAKPFTTYHNALDQELNLRIAPELSLKQMLIGGFNRIYEINRNFRNEGIDMTHNPEFTMLEFYESYSDAEKQMAFVEKLIKQTVKDVFKKNTVTYDGRKVSFVGKFKRVKFLDLIKKHTLISDLSNTEHKDVYLTAKQLGLDPDKQDSKEKMVDDLYKKLIKPKLIDPVFITDYPVEFSPFAKRKPEDPRLIDRFQLVAGGMEMVNAFSELNDPIDQRSRYEEQDKKGASGDVEISPSDEEFLEAMEYGLPPAGGVGIGIDRLIMLLTDTKNIREVIFFPTLKNKK